MVSMASYTVIAQYYDDYYDYYEHYYGDYNYGEDQVEKQGIDLPDFSSIS